ncbi:hypothetical protein [Natronoarchaeum rubrum]|uniref:hypothetical protein n=1 Tax=Natronoarchaeum rubrum TaxID=755311 RepID=UPI00211225B4|nr:hypothetical protein [Natronoarchaeum rubrum]
MNPFIELYRDPVATLTALAYALTLLTLLVITLAGTWRNAIWLATRWKRQRPNEWEYIPPTWWLVRLAAIPAVLAVDAWAMAALIWLVF